MTNQAPGILSSYFLFAILLTIPVSIVLLLSYRRAVARGMRGVAGALADSGQDAPGAAANTLATVAETTRVPRRERVIRLRLALVYSLGGGAAAAVLTGLVFLSPGLDFSVVRAFAVWFVRCWPIVPVLAVLLAWSRRKTLLAFLLYVAAGVTAILAWSFFSLLVLGRADTTPFANAWSLLLLLGWEASLPYLFILITGGRRLRAVSPLVLAGLLVFSYCALILLNVVFVTAMDHPSWRGPLLAFGPHSYYVWFMLAALPVGFACWRALRWLGERFEAKAFSDLQLLVDIWWLITIFSACATLASDLGWFALVGLSAFVVYRAVVALGLSVWRIDRTLPAHGRLLLLRVFGFQRRTEKLFDAVGERWRLDGSVKLIAGADLAMRMIDPGDFIAFVGGRVKHMFVRSGGDLAQRLQRLDETRDPDGRFRVSEFFCHDDTWRPTVVALALRSDVVLMDLRGFSRDNSGCLYELDQLVERGLLARTLFVTDDTTDVELLASTLTERARQVGLLPTNGALPKLNLEHARSQSTAELNRIYGTLEALA